MATRAVLFDPRSDLSAEGFAELLLGRLRLGKARSKKNGDQDQSRDLGHPHVELKAQGSVVHSDRG